MMKNRVLCGIDVLEEDGVAEYLDKCANRCGGGHCGLITNPTGVDRMMHSDVDVLSDLCSLEALFGPEHGVRGDAQAGADIEVTDTDRKTGIPVFSQYGSGRSAALERMAKLDTVFFDIQDVGVRYYTYQYTMTEAMEACAEAGVRFVVLDRPNPIGGIKVEGTILDRRFSSFVGKYPTAARSGLTVGEFARYINESEHIGCDLTVVPCRGWNRELYYDETDLSFVSPSPNLPTVDTAVVYAGTCLFEGTNISEGRGTTRPFEIIGAPWIDGDRLAQYMGEVPGALLRPAWFTPTFSKHSGKLCGGVQIHVTDRDTFVSFDTGVRLLCAIKRLWRDETVINPGITRLFGRDEILNEDFDPDEYLKSLSSPLEEYRKATEEYMIY